MATSSMIRSAACVAPRKLDLIASPISPMLGGGASGAVGASDAALALPSAAELAGWPSASGIGATLTHEDWLSMIVIASSAAARSISACTSREGWKPSLSKFGPS